MPLFLLLLLYIHVPNLHQLQPKERKERDRSKKYIFILDRHLPSVLNPITTHTCALSLSVRAQQHFPSPRHSRYRPPTSCQVSLEALALSDAGWFVRRVLPLLHCAFCIPRVDSQTAHALLLAFLPPHYSRATRQPETSPKPRAWLQDGCLGG
ncbi:hypothetical protein GGR55DRAFT_126532 [Xylaria sp. FL0064]|nr:hypothetical protein GGR55DRAFT_126532 [Xylaria sp. FL0064]